MKLHSVEIKRHILRVAPHAGAWIETPSRIRPGRWRAVAPHAGAWIETETL